LVPPIDSLIDPPAADHAVLPQDPEQHLPDLFEADRAPLDQADHHSDLPDQLRVRCLGQRRGHFGGARRAWNPGWGWSLGGCSVQNLGLTTLPLVLPAFILAPLFALVIGGAAPNGLSTPVLPPAAKGTAKTFAPGVAGMREKENPAMPASGQARSQVRVAFENGSKLQVILPRQSGRRTFPIPTRGELKMLCDLYCKKPKLSLKMLTLLKTPPSYRMDPKESRK